MLYNLGVVSDTNPNNLTMPVSDNMRLASLVKLREYLGTPAYEVRWGIYNRSRLDIILVFTNTWREITSGYTGLCLLVSVCDISDWNFLEVRDTIVQIFGQIAKDIYNIFPQDPAKYNYGSDFFRQQIRALTGLEVQVTHVGFIADKVYSSNPVDHGTESDIIVGSTTQKAQLVQSVQSAQSASKSNKTLICIGIGIALMLLAGKNK